MRVAERVAHLRGDHERDRDRHATARLRERVEQLRQVHAGQVLHHEIGRALEDAEVVNLHDARVRELRLDLGFGDEAIDVLAMRGERRQHRLDDHGLLEARPALTLGAVHHGHAALADAIGQEVGAEASRRAVLQDIRRVRIASDVPGRTLEVSKGYQWEALRHSEKHGDFSSLRCSVRRGRLQRIRQRGGK